MRSLLRSVRGYSAFEILIVFCICLLIVAIGFPLVTKVYNDTMDTTCQANMRVFKALYLSDYMTNGEDADAAVRSALDEGFSGDQSLICPQHGVIDYVINQNGSIVLSCSIHGGVEKARSEIWDWMKENHEETDAYKMLNAFYDAGKLYHLTNAEIETLFGDTPRVGLAAGDLYLAPLDVRINDYVQNVQFVTCRDGVYGNQQETFRVVGVVTDTAVYVCLDDTERITSAIKVPNGDDCLYPQLLSRTGEYASADDWIDACLVQTGILVKL